MIFPFTYLFLPVYFSNWPKFLFPNSADSHVQLTNTAIPTEFTFFQFRRIFARAIFFLLHFTHHFPLKYVLLIDKLFLLPLVESLSSLLFYFWTNWGESPPRKLSRFPR